MKDRFCIGSFSVLKRNILVESEKNIRYLSTEKCVLPLLLPLDLTKERIEEIMQKTEKNNKTIRR
jgi:hypothetical protein